MKKRGNCRSTRFTDCVRAVEGLEKRVLFIATPAIVEVPITAAALASDPQLAGFRTFDVRVSMSAGDRFVSAGLNVQLSQGSLYRYQDQVTPANDQWQEHPHLRFATFVSLNDFSQPSAVLPWTDVNAPLISDTHLQAGWAAFGGAPAAATEFTIARITVRSDSVGTLIGQAYGINNPAVNTPIVESILPDAQPLGWVYGHVVVAGEQLQLNGVTVFDDVDHDGVPDSGESSTVTTNGRYNLVLPPGSHRIRIVTPTDYVLTLPTPGYQEIVLTGGQVIANRNFTVAAPSTASVSGNVRHFDRLDNTPTEPSAGVTVFVDVNNNGVFDGDEPSAVTAADGTYLIGSLPAGSTIVREVVPPGFAPLNGASLQLVKLATNQAVSEVNFVNFQTTVGAARGTLIADASSSAPFGLGGWTVYLDQNRNGALDDSDVSTISGSDGSFELRAAPGTQDLRVQLPPDFIVTNPSAGFRTINLVGGSITGPHTLTIKRLAQFARVSGTIQRPSNEVPGGSPTLTGWTVLADANNNGQLDSGERTAVTNSDGFYEFTQMPGGNYSITVMKPNGWRYVSNTPSRYPVSLAPGFNIAGRDFLYTNRIMIAGVVFDDKNASGLKDAGENGVKGRRVWVDLNNNGAINAGEPGGYVGSKGMWSFESLVAGTYTVRVEQITGWRNTGTGAFTVTLAAGKVRVGVPFGQQKVVPVAGRPVYSPRNIGVLRAEDDLSSMWAALR